jgi:hypothetical protein
MKVGNALEDCNDLDDQQFIVEGLLSVECKNHIDPLPNKIISACLLRLKETIKSRVHFIVCNKLQDSYPSCSEFSADYNFAILFREGTSLKFGRLDGFPEWNSDKPNICILFAIKNIQNGID